MEDIYQWQYFISWQKLQANEVIVMASGAAFGVCHAVDVMMSWSGCLVHLDTLWLWFFFHSVGKQAVVPVPSSKGLLQVHYQKEMVFSHGHMFFGIPLCNSPETCLLPSEMVYIEIEYWNLGRDWKTNKSMTKEVLILKGKGLVYW